MQPLRFADLPIPARRDCTAHLRESFEPREASSLGKRIEFRGAPKRGSWFYMAEIEIGDLSRLCRLRCISERETMCRVTEACIKTAG